MSHESSPQTGNTEACEIASLPPRTTIELRGKDRATLLHNLCTADICRLKPGEGTEAFITNVKGRVIGHGMILCHEDRLDLDTADGQAAALLPHFDRYIIREDVQLADTSNQYRHAVIFGPSAAAHLNNALGEAPTTPYEHATRDQRLLIKTSILVEPNYLIRVSNDAFDSTLREIRESGAVPTTTEAFEVARINACFPYFGPDISEANLPQEIGRDELAISFTKGCYLGQETVARLDALGHVNWKLASLQAPTDHRITSGRELTKDGTVVARIASVAPERENVGPTCLAYLRSQQALPGSTLKTDEAEFVIQRVAGAE